MAFELPLLPYPIDALSPRMSKETLEIHYGRHHKTYVDNLNKLVTGTEFDGQTIETIIMSSSGAMFNNAAQVWNHTFFWSCLSPNGGGEPTGAFAEAIKNKFGSIAKFKELFADTSIKQFGSGWGWLVKNKNGEMEVLSTSNA